MCMWWNRLRRASALFLMNMRLKSLCSLVLAAFGLLPSMILPCISYSYGVSGERGFVVMTGLRYSLESRSRCMSAWRGFLPSNCNLLSLAKMFAISLVFIFDTSLAVCHSDLVEWPSPASDTICLCSSAVMVLLRELELRFMWPD